MSESWGPMSDPRRFCHGLVIGKFYPPHAGHHHLIVTAAEHCQRLSVVVMAATQESIALADRVAWLRAATVGLCGVRVVGVTDDVAVDFDDPDIWHQHVQLIEAALARAAILDRDDAGHPAAGRAARAHDPFPAAEDLTVDMVASSELYGAELARRLGAEHLLVDLRRSTQPVSGTAVRADLVGCWHRLLPPIRAGLALRVAVVGAESTGTTTVSRMLAEALRARGGVFAETGWVEEYGRRYTELRMAAQALQHRYTGRPGEPGVADLVWTDEDFSAVAEVQQASEDAAAATGSPVLICDTDVFATTVWHTRYVTAERLGTEAASAITWDRLPLPGELRTLAESRRADLYLLTDHVGVPFEQDGMRDGEHLRAWMTGEFRARLIETGRRLVELDGDLDTRVATALKVCDDLVATGRRFADPLG